MKQNCSLRQSQPQFSRRRKKTNEKTDERNFGNVECDGVWVSPRNVSFFTQLAISVWCRQGKTEIKFSILESESLNNFSSLPAIERSALPKGIKKFSFFLVCGTGEDLTELNNQMDIKLLGKLVFCNAQLNRFRRLNNQHNFMIVRFDRIVRLPYWQKRF